MHKLLGYLTGLLRLPVKLCCFLRASSRLLGISVLLHLVLLPLICITPIGRWPLILVLIANHVVLCVAGLLPLSTWLGENWNRLPAAAILRREIALTIDDGPDPLVTPLVLDILDRFGARASFFCIGERAEAYPDLCREILRRGHALENHSQRHLLTFACRGPGRMAREIAQGSQTLYRISGQMPLFFRPPAGLRNPFLDPLLRRFALHLASWTRRGYDTKEPRADVVLKRLLRNFSAGDILLLHDGNAARSASGSAVIVEVLPLLLQAALHAGLHVVTLRSALISEQSAEFSVEPRS